MKILLVRPPEFRDSAFAQMYPVYESVGLGYVAASLRQHGYDTEILDARVNCLDVEATAAKILSIDADLIGFSLPSGILFPQASEIIKLVKQKKEDVHISMGGQYPTFAYNYILSTLPEVDSIVRFEGDLTLPELVAHLYEPSEWINIQGLAFRSGDKVVTTHNRPLVEDLDTLPFPARDTLPKVVEKSSVAIVSTSRGCYAGCKFCSVRSFYRPSEGALWRARSPENVIEEIRQLKDKFNPDELWFADDNYFGPGNQGIKRAHDIFDLMQRNGIAFDAIDFSCRVNDVIRNRDIFELAKVVGLRTVFIGVESGVQRILDIYQKGSTVEQNLEAIKILREIGADVKMEFIFFNPWMTYNEVKENLTFLKKAGIYDPYILSSGLTIHTYSPLWQDIESGKIPFEAGDYGKGADFDADSYRPYKFLDERVKRLFNVVTNTFQLFEPIFHELWCLEDQVKKRRKSSIQVVQDHSVTIAESHASLTMLANTVALDLFEDALSWLEHESASEEQLLAKQEQFGQKINNLNFVISSVVRDELKGISEDES